MVSNVVEVFMLLVARSVHLSKCKSKTCALTERLQSQTLKVLYDCTFSLRHHTSILARRKRLPAAELLLAFRFLEWV